eukprot:1930205-Pyramimonas_sp.AAC.1
MATYVESSEGARQRRRQSSNSSRPKLTYVYVSIFFCDDCVDVKGYCVDGYIVDVKGYAVDVKGYTGRFQSWSL